MLNNAKQEYEEAKARYDEVIDAQHNAAENMPQIKAELDECIKDEEAKKYIRSMRKDVNLQLSSFSKIDEIQLQEEDFERTPTQKIKRFLYPKKNKKNNEDNKES